MSVEWCLEQLCVKGFTLAGGYISSDPASSEARLELAQVIYIHDSHVYVWLRYKSGALGCAPASLTIGCVKSGDDISVGKAFRESMFTDARWRNGEEAHVRVKLGENGVFAKAGDPWLMNHLGRASALVEPLLGDRDPRLGQRTRSSIDRLAASSARRVIEVVGRRS